jgi:DMSO/TMAO reductase YedYZ heme-binding membrane subunit
MIAAVSNSQALWYLTRGTGLVSLLLLTASVALGITEVTRWASPRLPRVLIAALHKNISLLVVIFLAVHIVTAVADNFAPIGWLDVVVPFHSPYRPVWLGLGTVAFDLLVAVVVTSLLRNRLGYRTWRAVHWMSYACWPVALLHGLGTGSDTHVRWSLALSISCLVLVLFAVWWRLFTARDAPLAWRAWTGLGAALLVWLILGWTFTGPDAPGWARRAGTPASLLGGPSPALPGSSILRVPFNARLTGTIRSTATTGNRVNVTIGASLSGGAIGSLNLTLEGTALGGGVQMSRGIATLGTVATPSLYQGTVVELNGNSIRAHVHDATGRTITLAMNVNIDTAAGTLTGTVSARGTGN